MLHVNPRPAAVRRAGELAKSARGCSRHRRFGLARRLTRAAYHRLEIIIRLDDLDQAILGGAVAAIGVGMVLLHQRLVFRLDGLERRVGTEPHHLQRLALGVEYFSGFDLGLGPRARPPAATAI